jgi:hypothetical protein
MRFDASLRVQVASRLFSPHRMDLGEPWQEEEAFRVYPGSKCKFPTQ